MIINRTYTFATSSKFQEPVTNLDAQLSSTDFDTEHRTFIL